MSVSDALLCEEEGTSESVMAVKAEGWGGAKGTAYVLSACPPGLLLDKRLLVPMASCCPFL